MSEKVKCTIDEVQFKDENFLSPIIATFQNGELVPKKAKTLKCSVFLNKKRKTRYFELESDLNSVSYTGSPTVENENTYKTMLAIRNSKTNKIRLIEPEMVVFAPCLNKEVKGIDNLNLTFDAKMQNLARIFGSKKGKRINDQRERFKTVGTEINDDLQETLGTIDVSVTEVKQDCAPGGIPWNTAAKKKEEVYNLFDLISKDQLRSLKTEARTVKNASPDLLKKQYTTFLVQNLPLVLGKNAQNKNKLKQDLEVLVYIDYLIMHAKLNLDKPFPDTDKICKTSASVNEKLIQEFSLPGTNNTRLCTTVMKDKAACHIIVLTMLLFNFEVSLKQLATALNHTIDKLKLYSLALGAVCQKDSNVAMLRVPLKIPKPRVLKKARR